MLLAIKLKFSTVPLLLRSEYIILSASAKSALYLSNTSRVTVSGGAFTIGYFNTNENVKVYYPKTATLADNKITSSENNILLSYGSLCKIVFEAVE